MTKWMLVLIHRDGDTKTCLGNTRDEVIALAKKVQRKFSGAYIAAFMPCLFSIIPTSEAKKIASQA